MTGRTNGKERDPLLQGTLDLLVKAGLTITRPGLPFARGLTAVGQDEFMPMGAEAVRIRFQFHTDGRVDLGLFDPEPIVTAVKRR